MKHLNEFTEFNLDKFVRGIDLIFVGCENWYDYEDKTKILGTKVHLVIVNDNHNYTTGQKDAKNNGEKLDIKVPVYGPDHFSKIDLMTKVEIVEPQKCAVWGTYRENLSITCKDIKAIK